MICVYFSMPSSLCYKPSNDLCVFQHALKSVLQATKASNDLPASGDDFDYYSTFEGFRDIMGIEGNRILHL
jgi:hypothetical protein